MLKEKKSVLCRHSCVVYILMKYERSQQIVKVFVWNVHNAARNDKLRMLFYTAGSDGNRSGRRATNNGVRTNIRKKI